MQAFILGAGLGTRLAPLTHILPKPLMPVFQKPLIQHTMDHYLRSGVTEFMVNISCLPLMWERAFPEPVYRGCPVSFSEEETPLDSGGGVKKIMPWVKPGEPLLVHNGDILTDIPVADLLAEHKRRGNLVTLALRSVDGKRNVGFDEETGAITDMRHALGVNPGTHQFAGVYLMEPEVAALFPEEDTFSIVPVWLELIKQGRVGGVVFDWANWHEIGSPADYVDTMMELTSRERIHPTASIAPGAGLGEDCVVGQDAVIPAGVVMDDCIVWPRTHVAPGTYRRCIMTPRIVVQG
jgi:mannose-1-phosphate guanylyltransferase